MESTVAPPIIVNGAETASRTTLESFVLERIESIQATLGSQEITVATLATMEALADDPVNKPALIEWLRDGAVKDDRRWEIRTALRALARVIQPRAYLEIGTRRGWSMAQVLAESPTTDVWSMDMWVEAYAGVDNPGPAFVSAEMAKAAPDADGRITFLNGNSHDLLPIFLDGEPEPSGIASDLALQRAAEERPRSFDLITVDGDHTAVGAWWDLCDVVPWLAIGGAVVFDDLLDTSDEVQGARATSRFRGRPDAPHDLRPSLLHVWEKFKELLERDFVFLENLKGLPPIGIGIRVR